MMGGNRALVLGLLHDFLQLLDRQLELMATALHEADHETIRREAHSVKGGAAVLAAAPLVKAAAALEATGSSGNLSGGEEGLRRLQSEVLRLRSYYNELQGQGG